MDLSTWSYTFDFYTFKIEDHEINPVDDHIDEFLADLSVDETKKAYKRIVQKLSQSQNMLRLPN